MALVRLIKVTLFIGVIGFAALFIYGYVRNNPQDMPWTPLDLTQPVGTFTGRKLVGLRGDRAQCSALLDRAGVTFTALPERTGEGQCGYADGVRLGKGGSTTIGFAPANLATSCSVAAGLALLEWHVIQPAALEHLGSRVTQVEHLGSYSCRRMYGRSSGAWSEHSTANAIDIAGFRLADGRRISVLRDWDGEGEEADFLREVRNGACKLYATVLSPDYNAAHRDHLHFDQAERGEMGWRGCR